MHGPAHRRTTEVHLPEPAAFMVARSGEIVSWGRAAERLTGIPSDGAIGQSCWNILAASAEDGSPICSTTCAYLSAVRPGGDGAVVAATLPRRGRTGHGGTPLMLRHAWLQGSAGPVLLHVVDPASSEAVPHPRRGATSAPQDLDPAQLTAALRAETGARVRAERRLATQVAVAEVLALAPSIEIAGQRLLEEICRGLDWEIGDLWLVDEQEGALRSAALWHADLPEVAEFVTVSLGIRFAPGVGLPGSVWASGQPSWIDAVGTDPLFLRQASARTAGIHSACAFPVVRPDGVIVGVLDLLCRERRPVDRALMGMLAVLGRQIGAIVGREAAEVERSRNELRERDLETQLRQAQRLESIGRLAGGVAHDFNNLLTVVGGFAEILLSDSEISGRHRSDIVQIRTAAEKAAALTRQLLAFSRRQVLQPRRIELNALVAGLQPMLERLIGEDVTVQVALAPDAGWIDADPGQIEQVVMNLAVNARDAMPYGGTIEISTGVETSAVGATVEPGRTSAGPRARLEVRDTGLGMDEATLARVFEPFFTTKEIGRGTGLGLATVYGIVAQSGGHIEATSTVGTGTTFTILLPQVAVGPGEPRPAVRAGGGNGQTRVETDLIDRAATILVVEEDPAVLRLAARLLAERGYRVIEAGTTADAIARTIDAGEAIDLALVELGGIPAERIAFVRSLRAALPAVGVLCMTDDADDAAAAAVTPDALVVKPFSADDLTRLVRRALGSRAGGRSVTSGAGRPTGAAEEVPGEGTAHGGSAG